MDRVDPSDLFHQLDLVDLVDQLHLMDLQNLVVLVHLVVLVYLVDRVDLCRQLIQEGLVHLVGRLFHGHLVDLSLIHI